MRRATLSFLAMGLMSQTGVMAQDPPKPAGQNKPAAGAKPKAEQPGTPAPAAAAPVGRRILEIGPGDQTLPIVDATAYFEFKGLTVEQLVGMLKARINSNISIKEEIKKAIVPDTVFSSDQLEALVQSLPALVEGLTIEHADNIMVIGGFPHTGKTANTVFLPVSLEPLVTGNTGGPFAIIGGGQPMEPEKKVLLIKSTLEAVRRGVELDCRVRGTSTSPTLILELHSETNLLLLGGPSEQVEAASKVLSALGLRVNSGRGAAGGGSAMGIGGGGMMPGGGGGVPGGGVGGPGRSIRGGAGGFPGAAPGGGFGGPGGAPGAGPGGPGVGAPGGAPRGGAPVGGGIPGAPGTGPGGPGGAPGGGPVPEQQFEGPVEPVQPLVP